MSGSRSTSFPRAATPATFLPPQGSVLGVDVGFSLTSRSSAVCRLDWTERHLSWIICRFRARSAEREATITSIAGPSHLLAASFDGPLMSGFPLIGRYRAAERMLTRRLQSKIGKPGQASAPVGKQLNLAANQCALAVKALCHVAPASHAVQIDDLALVEAFPTAFLGVMIADPKSLTSERSNRSDVFFQHLAGAGRLASLVEDLLPGRTPAEDWRAVTNHDDRAALICALTSLCVAAGRYVAVGDQDGWIVLPPVSAIQEWALRDLEANSRDEIAGCLHYA